MNYWLGWTLRQPITNGNVVFDSPSIQAYLMNYVTSNLRSFTPVHGILWGCYQAMRLPRSCYILLITNCNILREWVHQLKRQGHRLAARINKGGECGWFRIEEFGASAKVILVMDSSSSWVILEVAFLAVWSDWPPLYRRELSRW
jgi:hypothetical protein